MKTITCLLLLLATVALAGDPAEDIALYTAQADAVHLTRAPRTIAIYTSLADAYLRHYQADPAANVSSLLRAQKVALIAARLGPQQVDARTVLARALELGGKSGHAVQQARLALVLDPQATAAKEVLDRLGAPVHAPPDKAALAAALGPAGAKPAPSPDAAAVKAVGIAIVVILGVVLIIGIAFIVGIVLLIKFLTRKKQPPAAA